MTKPEYITNLEWRISNCERDTVAGSNASFLPADTKKEKIGGCKASSVTS